MNTQSRKYAEETKNDSDHNAVISYQDYLSEYITEYDEWRRNPSSIPAGKRFIREHDGQLAAEMSLLDLEWDTECFGFRVCRLDILQAAQAKPLEELLNDIRHYALSHDIRLITCRIPYSAGLPRRICEKVGFQLVDVMNIFLGHTHTVPKTTNHNGRHIPIESIGRSTLSQEDQQAILRIGSQAFTHGRINNDPTLSEDHTRRFYNKYMNSCLNNDHLLILVARIEGRVAGFVIGEFDDRFHRNNQPLLGYLKLIAIDSELRGRGIGQRLMHDFWLAMSRRTKLIEVGTQVDNYKALNLYAACGLKPVSSLITFHLWLG